jgi:hypothetical protein
VFDLLRCIRLLSRNNNSGTCSTSDAAFQGLGLSNQNSVADQGGRSFITATVEQLEAKVFQGSKYHVKLFPLPYLPHSRYFDVLSHLESNPSTISTPLARLVLGAVCLSDAELKIQKNNKNEAGSSENEISKNKPEKQRSKSANTLRESSAGSSEGDSESDGSSSRENDNGSSLSSERGSSGESLSGTDTTNSGRRTSSAANPVRTWLQEPTKSATGASSVSLSPSASASVLPSVEWVSKGVAFVSRERGLELIENVVGLGGRGRSGKRRKMESSLQLPRHRGFNIDRRRLLILTYH